MATARQKKVAKLIIENAGVDEPLNGGQMLEKVGYSEGIQKYPSRVIDSEGVKEALNDYGFNEESAKQVVASILHDETKDANARLKASDMIFKVHGTYAPEKKVVANIDITPESNKETEALAEKYEEELMQKYLGTTRTNINTPLDN